MHEHRNYAQDLEESNATYKDVVIVGNGPSGICLSYMLAGNWPYYTGEPHPGDEMLTARLLVNNNVNNPGTKNGNNGNNGTSSAGIGLAYSTRWGLESLSLGLEGRNGGRPLALLMDHLQHPCADAGLDLPPLLTWRPAAPSGQDDHADHKIIDHVVLGKGPPGGAWQAMDPNVLTISLARWMSLPGLDLRSWEQLVDAEQRERGQSTTGNGDYVSNVYQAQEKTSSCKGLGRVSVGTVAKYYKDYVRRQGLQKYFRCGTTVTSVRAVRSQKDKEGQGEDGADVEKWGWIVEGIENETGRRFRYRSKRVVLATGATDLTNRLGLPGEGKGKMSQSSWLTHDLNDLEARLDCIVAQHKQGADGTVEPVLIVGAGLSAADAVMAARFRGLPVLHVFRQNNNPNHWPNDNKGADGDGTSRLQWLPASMYPEYHKVYEMMVDGGTNYPLYKALPNYTLVDLGPNATSSERNRVTLCAPNGHLENFHVSVAAVLIGSRPDLSYLRDGNLGLGLGQDPTRPIDSKSNPIEVDEFTYEIIQAPGKGLYALGPLVGENFVRFILGGAFGILTHILSTITPAQHAKQTS